MSDIKNKCPVCNNPSNKQLYNLDPGYLISCDHCQTVFYNPRPTPQELVDFYNSDNYRECYQNSSMAGKNFAEARYRQLFKLLDNKHPNLITKKDKHLLDIGCGEGDLLIIAAADSWQVTGTEISPQAAEKANKLLPNRILTGELTNLDLPENSYDLITIYHVIEHLLDPVSILVKIRQLLKPGGIAFIETPNIASLGAKIKGKQWSHIIPPEHITYFQPKSLKYALKQSGFKQFEVFTNSPHIVESVANWHPILKFMANTIYRIAPSIGMGAALQAIAVKS